MVKSKKEYIKRLAEAAAERNQHYTQESGYEADLTKETCSPELWEQLGGDTKISDKEFEQFDHDFNAYPTKEL